MRLRPAGLGDVTVSVTAFAAVVFAAGAAPVRAAPAAAPADTLAPLTDTPGDAGRGRAIVTSRQTGLCLLCHAGPFPEAPQQGNLGPSLVGVGSRYTEAQLRLRVANPRRLHPDTLMPAYAVRGGRLREGAAWRGQPVLTPQQIEDVVALLATLRE